VLVFTSKALLWMQKKTRFYIPQTQPHSLALKAKSSYFEALYLPPDIPGAALLDAESCSDNSIRTHEDRWAWTPLEAMHILRTLLSWETQKTGGAALRSSFAENMRA
jgi:hypothetical protein